MFIYLVVEIMLLLSFLVEYEGKLKANLRLFSLYLWLYTGIFFIFFIGFRTCGFDYYSYKEWHQVISTSSNWLQASLWIGAEPGYGFLNHLIGNYQWVLFVMAVATLGILFSFFYKYSPYYFLSLILYLPNLYGGSMGQMRQALAVAIGLWAIASIQNKKKFFILLVCALMFHVSAVFLLMLLFIPQKLQSRKYYFVGLLVAVCINWAGELLFVKLVGLFPEFIARKIEFYMIAEEGYTTGLNLSMILRLLVVGSCLLIKPKLCLSPVYSWFFNVYFFGVLFYIACGFLPQMGVRGSLYFSFLEYILVPLVVFYRVGSLRWVVLFFFLFLSVYRQVPYFSSSSMYADEYVPYTNYFLQ